MVWMALPPGSGQGVVAMSAMPNCHCPTDRTAYVLNSSAIQYIVTRYVIDNIDYMIDDREILLEPRPRTTFINNGSISQQVTREVEYSYEQSHSWSTTFWLEIGVEATVTAGVPLTKWK